MAMSPGCVLLASYIISNTVHPGKFWTWAAARGTIPPPSGERAPRGGHGLVVAGGLGVPLVHRQQIGIALPGDIKTVAVGTAVGLFLPRQSRAADGADAVFIVMARGGDGLGMALAAEGAGIGLFAGLGAGADERYKQRI